MAARRYDRDVVEGIFWRDSYVTCPVLPCTLDKENEDYEAGLRLYQVNAKSDSK